MGHFIMSSALFFKRGNAKIIENLRKRGKAEEKNREFGRDAGRGRDIDGGKSRT